MLAFKVPREEAPSLRELHSRVQDVFNLLEVRLLSRIEQQLLEVLSSQPAPSAPQPHLASLCPTACVPNRANAVQVLDWRIPMEAGQYQAYADELFGMAADALFAPPMQVPQILLSCCPV